MCIPAASLIQVTSKGLMLSSIEETSITEQANNLRRDHDFSLGGTRGVDPGVDRGLFTL